MQIEASRAKFEQIIQLLQQGELDKALQQCRGAVQRAPRDVNMLGLMGAILLIFMLGGAFTVLNMLIGHY